MWRKKRAIRTTAEKPRAISKARFIQLYTLWERTQNPELIPLLFNHLERVVKLEPKFDLRRQFEAAF